MAYEGLIIPIQVGQIGLQTDVSQVQQTPVSLLMATNITCRYGNIEKDFGSQKWNASALPAGVVGLADWWPDDQTQRVIAACRNGILYRYESPYSVSAVLSDGNVPAAFKFTDQTYMVTGGSEQLNAKRKLFIMTGSDPVQVITGDGKTRKQISKPAADWTYTPGSTNNLNSYPTAGIVFGGGLWVWGARNNKHALYRSSVTDHEDFQTNNAIQIVTVFPGEGDGISTGFAWKSRLFVLKYPLGLYYIDTTNAAAPFAVKLSSSFGADSAHAAIQTLDDMLIGNSVGSVTSLKAVQALGESEQGDLLKMLRCVKQVQGNSNPSASGVRQAVYYEDKKQSLFVYRSPSGQFNDRILVIDQHDQNPKVTWLDKDQPNCLSLVRDNRRIPRPFYGAENGFIYSMDSLDRNVGGVAYTGSFQTPYLDFAWVDPKLSDRDKIFEFIGLTFESQGNWNISADIFVDDRFVQTVQISMSRGKYLSGAFPLNSARLNGPNPISRHIKIEGFGKRISARFYNTTVGQNFKISEVQFYFRLAGTKNR